MRNKIYKQLVANKMLDADQVAIDINQVSDRKKFIEERVEEYIEIMLRSKRPKNTVRNFENLLRRLRAFNESAAKTYRLDHKWFSDWVEHLTESGLINSSISSYMERLCTVLNYFNISYSHNLPLFYLRREAKHKIEDEILNDQEIERIWNYSPKETPLRILRDKALVSLYTGCRWGELPTIFKTLDDNGVKMIGFYAEKQKDARIIPLHPRIEPLIDEELFKNDVMLSWHFPIFLNALHIQGEGLQMERQGGDVIRQMVSRKNIVTFHSFRKTFCIRMLESGFDTYSLANYLGHHSMNTVLKFYSTVRTKQLMVRAAEIFKNIK